MTWRSAASCRPGTRATTASRGSARGWRRAPDAFIRTYHGPDAGSFADEEARLITAFGYRAIASEDVDEPTGPSSVALLALGSLSLVAPSATERRLTICYARPPAA